MGWLRRYGWLLLPAAGCLPLVFIALGLFAMVVVLLAGVGGVFSFWTQFLGPGAPAIATVMSRPAAWLVTANRDAIGAGLPGELVLAVIEQASDGKNFTQRYYCTNGRSAGEGCAQAYHPGMLGIGPSPAGTLGSARGLMGLIQPPQGRFNPFNPAMDLETGAEDLVRLLGGSRYWKSALNAFHATYQTPPGYAGSGQYADRIRALVGSYSAGPQVGAWTAAAWSSKHDAFRDPGDQAEQVFVVAVAPGSSTWSHPWKPPYQVCPVSWDSCYWVHPMIQGKTLRPPVAVTGDLANGGTVPFFLSSTHPAIPHWTDETLWSANVPLAGPDRLVGITARWPHLVDRIRWPEAPTGVISTSTPVTSAEGVAPWWPDILAVSRQTGVPATWLAAEMANESGGDPTAGSHGLMGAYGLMQLEPGTLGATNAQRENPLTNLRLGAEYLARLHAQFGSWRLAAAAYLGGPGSVQWALGQAGLSWPLPWSQAVPALAVYPCATVVGEVCVPALGNPTMAAYADNIAASAAALHPPRGTG